MRNGAVMNNNKKSFYEYKIDPISDGIISLEDVCDVFRHCNFMICEILVEESKRHMTPERALDEIRECLKETNEYMWAYIKYKFNKEDNK